MWCFSSTELSALVEREAAGNLKRTWVNHGRATDWATAEGRRFLQASVEVKTIWVPYGE
jgi:aldehyde dehydrogenase (NAD+)